MTFSVIEHARLLEDRDCENLMDRLASAGAGRVYVYAAPKAGGHGSYIVSCMVGRYRLNHEASSLGAALRKALRAVSAQSGARP